MKEYIPTIISVLLGGGFLTGIYMLLKLRPEAGQITVTAAQGAVIVQSGVIENLNKELHRLEEKIMALENEKREETERLRAAIATLQEENAKLRARVRQLENPSGV